MNLLDPDFPDHDEIVSTPIVPLILICLLLVVITYFLLNPETGTDATRPATPATSVEGSTDTPASVVPEGTELPPL